MEGFLISVSVLLAAIFREYGWTMLAIAVAVLLGYTLGSRLANATEAYTRHACCTDIARLASLVYLAHRTHPKHQKKKIMRAMWIVPVGLLLSNCSGGGGLVGSIDDSYCRRQVEQKTMSYDECKTKLAESRRQSFANDMVNRSALTNSFRH